MVRSFGYVHLKFHKVPLFRYCVPMDNDRPSLDLKYFYDICPNKDGMSNCNFMNQYRIDMGIFQVPVIALFTKYDQFKREVSMKLEDRRRISEMSLEGEMESLFRQQYLTHLEGLEGLPPFIRLESEKFVIN
jgi:hypothetical protein